MIKAGEWFETSDGQFGICTGAPNEQGLFPCVMRAHFAFQGTHLETSWDFNDVVGYAFVMAIDEDWVYELEAAYGDGPGMGPEYD